MKKNGNLVDYIFWILFIIYTNPGGILEAIFKEDRGDGGINIVDFVFVLMFVCYMFIFYQKDLLKDILYSKTLLFIIYYVLYLYIVFGFLVPAFKETPNSSFITVFVKSRTTIFNLFLFVMIYSFFFRSYFIFIKIFMYSSVIVMVLFLISILTGVDILPIEKMNRGFIRIDRIFLIEYGLMPILIPMGIVVFIFKVEINIKRLILFAFGLMFIVWLISLTRRHIFGTIVYLFIALLFYNYYQHKALISISRMISISIYTLFIGVFLYLAFPEYINAGIKTFEETLYVMINGETKTGVVDQRLGFNKKFIVDKFIENPIFGTGFDNRWRTAAGGQEGYEAADYPFLSALAMSGISGIIFFLPIYILLIKALFRDIRFFRNTSLGYNSIEFFFIMTFIIFFSFDLIQYMNWFRPVSEQANYEMYVYLAMYFASRKLYYSSIRRNSLKIYSPLLKFKHE